MAKPFGPPTPPSSWPLDSVPIPILNSIVQYLIDMDQAKYSDTLPTRTQIAASRFPSNHPEFQHFGRYSKPASLINKAFRTAIVKRGVFNHVVLGGQKHVERTARLLDGTTGVLSYVT
jgi:hypothetical protein